MEFGIIGLGRMGANLALQALDNGMRVVGFDPGIASERKAESVMALFKSRDSDNDAPKAVAIMRHEFGGHPFGRAEAIARERQTGKVGLVE